MRSTPPRSDPSVADPEPLPSGLEGDCKRRPVKVTLLYPMDLLGSKEGGAETFIRGFIKHAPADFDLEFLGVTSNRKERPPRRAQAIRLSGRTVEFRPMISVRNENRRGWIPVSLRFTLALVPLTFRPGHALLLFNRIEPALVFRRNGSARIGIVHTDIQRQCAPGKTEVLWARWPGIYSRFERRAIRRFDAVFSSSQSTLDHYDRLYPALAQKMSFLPSWADPEVFLPRTEPKSALRASLGRAHSDLPLANPWVLFVGRLQAVKAPLRAIQGFQEYLRIRGHGVLIMIGEGNLKERLASHIRRLGLESRVFLLGDMGQDELARFYQAADVLLLTSHYEGMPCCVLEALGSGTPVVTTDVGEVRRVVREGHSGAIVDGQASSIAAALDRVIGNPVVYAPGNCLEAVAGFTPGEVLVKVFDKIRRLDARLAEKEAKKRPSAPREE